MPAARAELAEAIKAVNAAFERLPGSAQAQIDPAVDGLEAEINAAILAGDRTRARAAIRAWRGHWLSEIERAGT